MSALVVNKKKFDEDGYLLVKNVFNSQEIEQFRLLAQEQYEIDKVAKLDYSVPNPSIKAKFVHGDLLGKEKLYKVLLHERILDIAKGVLGTNDLVYFRDSTYQIGTGFRGFHRDNIDRDNLDGPDWKGEYTLVRFGIYLQNHKDYSGGLKIKKGSHKQPSGDILFVDNEEGDVVVWSLKTVHSGNAVRLKWFPNYSINTAGKEDIVPSFLKKDQQKERISLFMTFGVRSSHLDYYIKEYMMKRQNILEHLKSSRVEDGALKMAADKKVEIHEFKFD